MLEYMYLWICLLLFIPWAIIYLYTPQLRNRMIKSGLIAIPFGVTHLWFRVDYWQPPEVLFLYIISLEDILFGFVTTGIGISVFDALFTSKQVKLVKDRKKIALSFFPIIVVSFFILKNGVGFNSMFMWVTPVILAALVIIIMRKDLLIPSLVTAFVMTLFALIIYIILFNYISPKFWDTYWLLANSKYGITVFDNVPVLELLWYFSYGLISGIMYDFTKGTKKVPNKLGKKLFG